MGPREVRPLAWGAKCRPRPKAPCSLRHLPGGMGDCEHFSQILNLYSWDCGVLTSPKKHQIPVLLEGTWCLDPPETPVGQGGEGGTQGGMRMGEVTCLAEVPGSHCPSLCASVYVWKIL